MGAMKIVEKVVKENWECSQCHIVWFFEHSHTNARERKEGLRFYCWNCRKTTLHTWIRKMPR